VAAFIFFWYLAITIRLSDSLIYHIRICTMRVFYVFYKKKVELLLNLREVLRGQVYQLSEKYGNMYIKNYNQIRLFKLQRRKSEMLIDQSYIYDHLGKGGQDSPARDYVKVHVPQYDIVPNDDAIKKVK